MYTITLKTSLECNGSTYLIGITSDVMKFFDHWISERSNILKPSIDFYKDKFDNQWVAYQRIDGETIRLASNKISENGITTFLKLEGDVEYQF